MGFLNLWGRSVVTYADADADAGAGVGVGSVGIALNAGVLFAKVWVRDDPDPIRTN